MLLKTLIKIFYILRSLKKLDVMQQAVPAIRTLYDNTLFVCSNCVMSVITTISLISTLIITLASTLISVIKYN